VAGIPLADVDVLELRALAARWPRAPDRAFDGVNATVAAGE